MSDALDRLSKEELISYAKMLIAGAVDRLEMDMPEEAAWRIANALGTMAAVLAESPTPVPGIHTHTNLGYKLEVRTNEEAAPASLPK